MTDVWREKGSALEATAALLIQVQKIWYALFVMNSYFFSNHIVTPSQRKQSPFFHVPYT